MDVGCPDWAAGVVVSIGIIVVLRGIVTGRRGVSVDSGGIIGSGDDRFSFAVLISGTFSAVSDLIVSFSAAAVV